MENLASEELSEDEFHDRIVKYESETGAIKGPECIKGFSTALFKRREKCKPHRKALQMLKLCRDEGTFTL